MQTVAHLMLLVQQLWHGVAYRGSEEVRKLKKEKQEKEERKLHRNQKFLFARKTLQGYNKDHARHCDLFISNFMSPEFGVTIWRGCTRLLGACSKSADA